MNQFSPESTDNLVALLRRTISRERQARKEAEKKLEEISWKIYQTNQSLSESLNVAKKRESELTYLNQQSTLVSTSVNLYTLLSDTVDMMGTFAAVKWGVFAIFNNEQLENKEADQVWCKNIGWHNNPEMFSYIIKSLPFQQKVEHDKWLFIALDASIDESNPNNWLICMQTTLATKRNVWIAYIVETEFVDPESLYVMDTAVGYLLNGIRRSLNEIRLNKRNVQLQQTIDRLEETRRQLVQSEKMASLGQLAAGVAHEINNPIGYIRSNLEVFADYLSTFRLARTKFFDVFSQNKELSQAQFLQISEELQLDFLHEDARDMIASNIEGIDKIRDIIDSLKTFSHKGELKFTPVCLLECIDNALKIVSNAFKYEHEIDNQLPSELPMILGIASQLQQVFVNLFVNAAQAMPSPGVLSIAAEITPNTLRISVNDTGIGMSEETIKMLFTPFFTTKAVGVGTGLGMSVSYAIIEAHKGEIEVKSELGKGSQFKLVFPLPQDEI